LRSDVATGISSAKSAREPLPTTGGSGSRGTTIPPAAIDAVATAEAAKMAVAGAAG